LAHRRAVVVGGSLGGLFAGVLLQREGWHVSVHERAGTELASRGAGIVTHDELHRTLALATGRREPIGVPVSERVVFARDGSIQCRMPRPQVLASWDQLWRRLRDSLEPQSYRHGSTLVDFDQSAGGAVARFQDGETIEADLIVAADGIQSSVRRRLLPDVKVQYVGYCAWRGLVEEARLSAGTRNALNERFSFCLPAQQQMLGYPVDAPSGEMDRGWRFNFVWYRPASETGDLPRLLTGADGKRYENAIPPDRLHPEVLAEMRTEAARSLDPAFAEVVAHTRQPLLQPIYDLGVPQMTFGRVILLGDSAFVARPHVGMGVTKAAGDARVLAAMLASETDTDTALARFNAERVAFGERILRRARHLGAYLQAQRMSEEERRHAGRHRDPLSVMRETASMEGIDRW
jgi:2-polyprenyl-6-methoxyphenol hydroxylase-like FAD-dependent oxidoreductase